MVDGTVSQANPSTWHSECRHKCDYQCLKNVAEQTKTPEHVPNSQSRMVTVFVLPTKTNTTPEKENIGTRKKECQSPRECPQSQTRRSSAWVDLFDGGPKSRHMFLAC